LDSGALLPKAHFAVKQTARVKVTHTPLHRTLFVTASRLVHLEQARARFGQRADRLAPLLAQGDALADAAVEALGSLSPTARESLLGRVLALQTPKRLPEDVRHFRDALLDVPFWADEGRAARGGAVLLRTGIFGGLVLAFRSLLLGYCSPAGNKPLVFSGRLRASAARRLSETGRFVQSVYLAGGVAPGAPGFIATARVRLMHAQVRRLLRASPRWDTEAWGLPINQLDMAGTVLLFSLVVVDGLRRFGFKFSAEEVSDVLHLWRTVGWLLGVRVDLLSSSESDARAMWDLIRLTQRPPDADSVQLAHALVDSPLTEARTKAERSRAEGVVALGYGLSRFLLDDGYAEALGLPKNGWRFVVPALRGLVSTAGRVLGRLPGSERLRLEAGLLYWQHVVSVGLGEKEATFALPDALKSG
jgi:ER-bound oxygenase mpaB/B'/Rubber oxygenase, catalytic domain